MVRCGRGGGGGGGERRQTGRQHHDEKPNVQVDTLCSLVDVHTNQ